MTCKTLMILGAFGGVVLAVTNSINPAVDASVALFGFGALFGKGYGIWEARAAVSRGKDG